MSSYISCKGNSCAATGFCLCRQPFRNDQTGPFPVFSQLVTHQLKGDIVHLGRAQSQMIKSQLPHFFIYKHPLTIYQLTCTTYRFSPISNVHWILHRPDIFLKIVIFRQKMIYIRSRFRQNRHLWSQNGDTKFRRILTYCSSWEWWVWWRLRQKFGQIRGFGWICEQDAGFITSW